MSDSEKIGVVSKVTRLEIHHFPDRKKPCLCLEQDNRCIVIGTLRNEECEELYYEFCGGWHNPIEHMMPVLKRK